MALKLTDTAVKLLDAPASGNRITYDAEVKGFGCRVTAKGARSFILNYRTKAGRERRITIGAFPDWKASVAREEAKSLKRRVDVGQDPMAELETSRDAKTMADLCQRFTEDHLPKKRATTRREYESQIQRHILPALKHVKIADVSYSDIETIHRKITRRGQPYHANRVLALMSKMFSLSIRWGWRTDNPAKGVERNQEEKRKRYLSQAEIAALTEALAASKDVQGADIVRLLLLTGARRGEVFAARWDQFDLVAGTWLKPGATTKQKTDHHVPLSAPARQLLTELKRRTGSHQYVFPGRSDGHRVEIKNTWRDLCLAAGIVTTTEKDGKVTVKPSARLHDLRHTYASILASAGLSLPIIGALLGHTQPATTARYAHLFDDPLRAATERVGAAIMPPLSAEIIELKQGA